MQKILKAFNSCWIYTKDDDIFLGRVATNRIDNGKLIAVLTPVFQIQKIENSPEWKIMNKRVRYEFIFDTPVQVRATSLKTEFTSSASDRVILSVDPDDADTLAKMEKEFL